MKSVVFVFDMPHGNEYVGGIASILNQYIKNKFLFEKNDVSIKLLDLHYDSNKRLPKIINKFIVLTKGRKKLYEEIKKNPDCIYHIHTSIRWTLFKDLYYIRSLRKKHHGKFILSIHFADREKILPRNKLLRKWELSVLRNDVDKIIFLSKNTMEEFVDSGLSKTKASTLYTFHSFDSSLDFPNKNNLNDKVQLLFMGSIDYRKGILDLLKSIESIDNEKYLLHVCGQITKKDVGEIFKKKVDDSHGSIVFHGYVSGDEKENLMKDTDILVLPSYGEGMPIVIMEAMSKGCAIISTNVGAIPEIINDENGILISPGDTTALHDALIRYIGDKDKLFNTQLKNFKYGKKFSLKENINKLSYIYKDLD